MTGDSAEGRALIERLRAGGLVLFFRHADPLGRKCDRTFGTGDRDGQRNISAAGRDQSRRIGEELRARDIRIALPVLAGPVFRARDTAELAFGESNVRVTDDLIADDYAGGRLDAVLAAHARLFSDPVAPGANRVLVGHRTPAIMVLGESVAQRAFPEGSALVLEPVPPRGRLLGIWMPAPIEGAGFHSC
ncbi:MAG: histidine phosphatase family protein [Alphaproteobacteria bacterium]|nr:histidine phosphatase family protein [Alphaproteobacteria bacterium]